MNSGIYTITSPSGKRYVGSAVNFAVRWGTHRYRLRRGNHANCILQAAWNKYGEDGMKFERILECPVDQLIRREQEVIDRMNPEYNIARVAGSTFGMIHSDGAKARIGAAVRGKRYSEEHRRKISEGRKGMVFTPNHRANISAATKGKTKNQSSQRGRAHSEAHKAKIAAAMRGVPKSPEAKANMLVARRLRLERERQI